MDFKIPREDNDQEKARYEEKGKELYFYDEGAAADAGKKSETITNKKSERTKDNQYNRHRDRSKNLIYPLE